VVWNSSVGRVANGNLESSMMSQSFDRLLSPTSMEPPARQVAASVQNTISTPNKTDGRCAFETTGSLQLVVTSAYNIYDHSQHNVSHWQEDRSDIWCGWLERISSNVAAFLADRTNGRALSVCRLSVTYMYVLWLNGASNRKTVGRSK